LSAASGGAAGRDHQAARKGPPGAGGDESSQGGNPMSAADLAASAAPRFPQVRGRPSTDCPAFDVPAEVLVDFLRYLRDERAFDLLADVSGIDWGVDASPRFGVAYHLLSTAAHEYVRVVTVCSGGEPPRVPSVTSLFPAADWHEREAFDMFGIR